MDQTEMAGMRGVRVDELALKKHTPTHTHPPDHDTRMDRMGAGDHV